MKKAMIRGRVMKSLDELFGDEDGREEFLDTLGEALSLNSKELKAIDVGRLRALFGVLPEPVQNVAYEWGLADAMFVNNARLYIRRYPSRYRSALGLENPG
jgi:hypothetical protein